MKKIILISILGLFLLPLSAQDDSSSGFNSSYGFSIGTVTLDNTTYNSVRFIPDFALGNLGVGLDLDFRFTLDQDENGDTRFNVYEQDWYFPDGGSFQEYLNLYLSKISYLRWGKDRDPLFLRFGNLTGSSLGTGFIMGGYSNTQFLPEKRIFGGQFNVDGALFDFPYVGVQALVGNLSQFDLFGGRMYVRPAAGTTIPILKNMEIGGSYFADRNAYLYLSDEDENGFYDYGDGTIAEGSSSEMVSIYGFDTIIPILSSQILSLALMADMTFQGLTDPHTGVMTGFAGKALFFNYAGQVRFMGENFIPGYFDQTYDLQRAMKYDIYSNAVTKEASNAYFVSMGTSFMADALVFNVSVDGPFEAPTGDPITTPWEYPHVKGVLVLQEGVIEFADFQFWYDKMGVDTFSALISPENAIIGGLVNFRMSPAVITAQVDVKYDPNDSQDWKVTSQLTTGIKF